METKESEQDLGGYRHYRAESSALTLAEEMMRTLHHLACAATVVCALSAHAENDQAAEAGVVLATNVIEITAGQSVTPRCHVVNSEGQKQALVFGPRTHSGSEGYDLALEFQIEWGKANRLVLSEQTLLYRNANTFAYQVSSTKYQQPTACLVVVHNNEATLYIDDHWLTRVPQEYLVSVRYRHYHQVLRDRSGLEQVWSQPAKVSVRVHKTTANKSMQATPNGAPDG